MKLLPIVLSLAFVTPAFAADEDVKIPQRPAAVEAPQRPVEPDPNAVVTLTYGELQALMTMQTVKVQAEIAASQAQPIIKKIQGQVAPTKPAQ